MEKLSTGSNLKILVRAPNWVGDQILSYPFYCYLRELFPKAKIISVCIPSLESIQYKNIVDEVISVPVKSSDNFIKKFSIIHSLAKEVKQRGDWDIGISLPDSFSAAWFLFGSKCKLRVGYRFDGRGVLLNKALPWKSCIGVHRAQAYLNLLKPLGLSDIQIKNFWSSALNKNFNPSKLWKITKPLQAPEGPFWVLAPGSAAASRRWPVAYFASLAKKVVMETGWKGVVVGGPQESSIARTLCEDRLLKLEDYTNRCKISELSEVFRCAQFNIANDSGLAHVASFCGGKVSVIVGAGDPKRTKPTGPGMVQLNLNPVACWPCERNVCFQSGEMHNACLNGISPDQVWNNVKTGLLGLS